MSVVAFQDKERKLNGNPEWTISMMLTGVGIVSSDLTATILIILRPRFSVTVKCDFQRHLSIRLTILSL